MRLEVYNRMLAAVHQKIRHTANLPNTSQMTYYDFPEWQPGCPRYDVKDCILYIVFHLRTAGFKVMYVSPNRIIVSWKEQSIQYYQEESPIRQAMMSAANQQTQAAAGPVIPGPPKEKEKKKAGSYRPPPEGIAGMLSQGGGASKKAGGTITFI